VLVYLLIVVNFQSWLDPFIIITALPAALAGICWFLLLTHTTLSVPSLTGSVMCMGVATANSILMVSFAREQMDEGLSAMQAAVSAGYTRMRPVLMTALAMIIGMVPMALGAGDGGEQNSRTGNPAWTPARVGVGATSWDRQEPFPARGWTPWGLLQSWLGGGLGQGLGNLIGVGIRVCGGRDGGLRLGGRLLALAGAVHELIDAGLEPA